MSRSSSRPAHRAVGLVLALAVVGVPVVLVADPAKAAIPADHGVQAGGIGLASIDQSAAASFTVPAGVCSVDWVLRGGSGGDGPGGDPGTGQYIAGSTATTAGTQYAVVAGGAGLDPNQSAPRGGQGANGMDGGDGASGGGGASRIVDTSTSTVVAVAAGGGGVGSDSDGGRGGSPGTAGSTGTTAGGGGAASSSAGGAAGSSPGVGGSAGGALVGGTGTFAGGYGGGGGGGGVFGGGGGGFDGLAGGGGGGGYGTLPAGWSVVAGHPATVSSPEAGMFLATFGLCPAPLAPTGTAATATGPTSATVSFSPGAATGMPVTGWEVSTDGGSTYQPLAVTGSSTLTGQVTGLAAATTYAVRVRAAYTVPTVFVTNGLGTAGSTSAGAVASTSVTTPAPGPAAPGAVGGVTATAGVASVAVAWTAPSSGGPVTSYTATASPGAATCTTTSTSCVLGGVTGSAYSVSVVANGPGGTSAPGAAQSGVVAAPAVPGAPPAGVPLTLTTTDGQISSAAPGQEITVVGTGFAPRSTVTVVVYSTPTVLGTVTTDASGAFARRVTVPASLASGQHTLLASGTDPAGNPHYLALPITVPATGGGATAALAATGFAVGRPVALGALALLSGLALLLLGRRRVTG